MATQVYQQTLARMCIEKCRNVLSVQLAPRLGKLGGQVLYDIEVDSGDVASPALLGMDRFPPEHMG